VILIVAILATAFVAAVLVLVVARAERRQR